MTDLVPSQDSKEYQKLAHDFFQNEVASKSEKLDHDGAFDEQLYKSAWELGLAGTFLPESCGGLGLSLWDTVLMAEEAGAASSGFASAFEGNILAAAPILLFGAEKQKQEYLPLLTEEPGLASFCFSAKPCGAFPAPAAVFRKQADKFIFESTKLVAINGSRAKWFLLPAQEVNSERLSVFLVPSGQEGLLPGSQIEKLGRRCADLCQLEISELVLGESDLVDKEGAGSAILLESYCMSAPVIASHAAGLIRSALTHSMVYAKERETFGKPISQHQAIAFMLAEIAKSAECARIMSWKAANLFDLGARDPFFALAARSYSAGEALAAATDAVQIFGGYGYSKEYPVERLMRDAKMMQLMYGTSHEINCTIAELELEPCLSS